MNLWPSVGVSRDKGYAHFNWISLIFQFPTRNNVPIDLCRVSHGHCLVPLFGALCSRIFLFIYSSVAANAFVERLRIPRIVAIRSIVADTIIDWIASLVVVAHSRFVHMSVRVEWNGGKVSGPNGEEKNNKQFRWELPFDEWVALTRRAERRIFCIEFHSIVFCVVKSDTD